MQKKKIVTIIIVIATLVLAGIAVFTAIRLYQLRQEAVAPTAPTSKPAAAELETQSCTALSFTIAAAESPTPTSTPTATPTATPTSTPTSTPTATPTSTPVGGGGTGTTTPTSTAEAQLPDAGISYPTLVGGGLGILVLLGSLLLLLF